MWRRCTARQVSPSCDSARKAGASYADIRINRYRNQFIYTRDRRVQNIVNTEDYGFGVRVIAGGTWGFASSSKVTPDEIARVAAQAVGIAKANAAINGEPVRLAPVEAYNEVWNTPVVMPSQMASQLAWSRGGGEQTYLPPVSSMLRPFRSSAVSEIYCGQVSP